MDWLPKNRAEEVAANNHHGRTAPKEQNGMDANEFQDLVNALIEAVTPIPGALEAITEKMRTYECRNR